MTGNQGLPLGIEATEPVVELVRYMYMHEP